MFAFFIALFGGLYFLIRISSDRAGARAYDRRISDRRDRREQWMSNVTDHKLEEELRLFISRPENLDAVQEEVAEAYDKVLEGRRIDELYPRDMWCKKGRDWSDEYHEKIQERVCRLNSKNALRIMMAKRGKLPFLDASAGASKGLSFYPRLEAVIFRWCAEELARHGMTERFCMEDPGMYGVRGAGWEL